jgi:hypothetical protein
MRILSVHGKGYKLVQMDSDSEKDSTIAKED